MVAILPLTWRLSAGVMLLSFASMALGMNAVEQRMYDIALERYQTANMAVARHFERHNLDPNQESKWLKSGIRNRWSLRAERDGAMFVGQSRDWLDRKITYYSSFVRPEGDALSHEMGLHRQLPGEDRDAYREAAIFWKHQADKHIPLKVDYLLHQRANYDLKPLKEVLSRSQPQIVPLR